MGSCENRSSSNRIVFIYILGRWDSLDSLTETPRWQNVASSRVPTRMLRQLCLRGTPRQSTARPASAVWAAARAYSSESGAGLAAIDPSKLSITKTTTPKDLLPPKDLVFGKNFTGMWIV